MIIFLFQSFCSVSISFFKFIWVFSKIARGDKVARRYFCTKILLHEQTILQGDNFAPVDFIFILLIYLYFNFFNFCSFFFIIVTPNPYPRSVALFFS